ncbi:TPR-like protein [Athelia psychrophila]|uniref:ER membrane protein complex subunit 2 n=1 Tax=Athelia psychrophila TaxID=1759441 RepID=A0A166TM87_9AGAM|nr:TPR-like protein [Fibularhizoctonia sp. CBS 109695]
MTGPTYTARTRPQTQQTLTTLLPLLDAHKLGSDDWTNLERLAYAALDMGRVDVADKCLTRLLAGFPSSPRVAALRGAILEASAPDAALKFYADVLELDSGDATIWKRQIGLLRRLGRVERAVTELCTYLDTFYSDAEAWLELADLYASCGHRYTQSLHALSHAQLLAPQNPFFTLQSAETAYTAGDLPLALRLFLAVVDMSDGDDADRERDAPPMGVTVRAWFGVKLCARRLKVEVDVGKGRGRESASGTESPKHAAVLEELAGERLRVAYSSAGRAGEIAQGRGEVFAWVAASD